MKRVLFFLGFLSVIGYLIWSSAGRNVRPGHPVDEEFEAVEEWGRDSGRGNLVGLQPYVVPLDYASEEAFYQKMSGYLNGAEQRGWLNPRTIVVLPEYLGTWLVVAGEKSSVYAEPRAGAAMTTLALSNFFSFLKARLSVPAGVENATNDALFRMKAESMAEIYQRTFSTLAKRFGVTIVAGSILLPGPRVEAGTLIVGAGPLQNVSAVFRPDGTLAGLSRKAFPTKDEQGFLAAADASAIPVFDTPAGRLGVLVCADAWFPQAYRTLRAKGATLLAVPSYSAGDGVWQQPWGGYSGYPTPPDARADIGKIREGDAWLRYTMGGRAKREGGIVRGMNVFLRGQLWDFGSDGTTILLNDSLRLAPRRDGPTLSCLWL